MLPGLKIIPAEAADSDQGASFSCKVQYHFVSLTTFWASNIIVMYFYSIYYKSWYVTSSDFS